MSRFLAALLCVLLLFSARASAQAFPSKPLTLICPCQPGSSSDVYLRAVAQIAAKHFGQRVQVENIPGETNTRGPAQMAQRALPDGYTVSMQTINAFRIPHLQRVSWDPLKDFTYIIGIAQGTFGVVVRADSQFKTLQDLIDYARSSPDGVRYGIAGRNGTAHLVMEELGQKARAKFALVTGPDSQAPEALLKGRILAISGTASWVPHVDSGAFRLLATFSEKRSRWDAPTAMELGYDILAYNPFGIVGPKGIEASRVKALHDAFSRVLDDPEYDQLRRRFDMHDWYKSGEDYADWAIDQFGFQRDLLKRTIGLPAR